MIDEIDALLQKITLEEESNAISSDYDDKNVGDEALYKYDKDFGKKCNIPYLYNDDHYRDEEDFHLDEWDIEYKFIDDIFYCKDSFRPLLYPRCFTSGMHQINSYYESHHSFSKKNPTEKITLHVESIKEHILAEFEGFLMKLKPQLSRYFPSQSKNSCKYWKISGTLSINRCNGNRMLTGLRPYRGSDMTDDSLDFHNHLVVHRGRLGILQNRRHEALLVSYGAPVPDRYWNSSNGSCMPTVSTDDVLVDLGYIGDYMEELATTDYILQELSAGKSTESISPLLPVIVDPNARSIAAYQTPPIQFNSWQVRDLNKQQQHALQSIKFNLEGIHGPPGTGKSTVISHLINCRLPPSSITLVTCVQNRAVNSISEKLAEYQARLAHRDDCKNNFIVFGSEDRIGEFSKNWTLEAQIEKDPQMRVITNASQRLLQLLSLLESKHQQKLNATIASSRRCFIYTSRSSIVWRRCWHGFVKTYIHRRLLKVIAYFQMRLNELKVEEYDTKEKLKVSIVQNTRVVVCTLSAATRSLLKSGIMAPLVQNISTTIIDEAGTVTDAKLLPLVLLPKLQHLICVGDHHQLLPYSEQRAHNFTNELQSENIFPSDTIRASKQMHAISFLERMSNALPPGSLCMLTEQYRMHPKICEFISRHFYSAKLITSPQIMQQRLRMGPCAMFWIDYPSSSVEAKSITAEKSLEGSSSLVNEFECDMVVKILAGMVVPLKHSVLVTAFYSEQVRLITSRLKVFFNGVLPEQLQIQTVDQSQGMEADTVLLSGVRSNSSGNIGFLSHKYRVNVAVSRAKSRVVVVADSSTVCRKSDVWRSLRASCRCLQQASELPKI